MIYRKKPVLVEARRFEVFPKGEDAIHQLAEWCGGLVVDFAGEKRIEIVTLEGTMYAMQGDWIIEGVAGEFYPCKPDIFDATYELYLDDEFGETVEDDDGPSND